MFVLRRTPVTCTALPTATCCHGSSTLLAFPLLFALLLCIVFVTLLVHVSPLPSVVLSILSPYLCRFLLIPMGDRTRRNILNKEDCLSESRLTTFFFLCPASALTFLPTLCVFPPSIISFLLFLLSFELFTFKQFLYFYPSRLSRSLSLSPLCVTFVVLSSRRM